MKKVLFALVIFCCVLCPQLFSMDLELIGGMGNLAFNQSRTFPLSNPDFPGAFSAQLYPLVLARVSGEYKSLCYNGGFERGPLLRNRLFANFGTVLDYFSIEAGPFTSRL